MMLISGYVCIYPQEDTLTHFTRLLQALLKNESGLSGYDVSIRGKSDFRKKKISQDKIEEFFVERCVDGSNLLVVRGECRATYRDNIIGEINISLLPSPTDKLWSPIGKNFPQSKSQIFNNTLRSLASHEGFAYGRGITDYPNLFLIFIEIDKTTDITSEELHNFGNVIAKTFDDINKWSAVFDAANYIPKLSASKLLAANPETVTRMDKFFLVSHSTVLGKANVIDSYFKDMQASFPDVALRRTNFKGSAVLSLEDWAERDKIFLPKWHENKWP